MRKSIADWVLIALTIAAIVAVGIYLIIAWGSIPDKIPTNYDFSGNITSYGGKTNIIAAYVMDIVVALSILIASNFPKSWNIPGKAKMDAKTFIAIKYMLEGMALIFALFFGYLIVIMTKLIVLKAVVAIVFIALLFVVSILPFVIPKFL